MQAKDYYRILDIQPSANHDEIRRAYRTLAKRYHPDRNEGNAEAAFWFREIAEAYEVLSDPYRREQYHQVRWFYQYTHQSFSTPERESPQTLLRDAGELYKYVRTLDIYRLDEPGLSQFVNKLISPDKKSVFTADTDPAVRREFISMMLRCIRPLSYPHASALLEHLSGFAEGDQVLLGIITETVREKKQEAWWDRNRLYFLLLAALLLALLMWWAVG